MRQIEVGRAAVDPPIEGVHAPDAGNLIIRPGLSLGFIDELREGVGALELHAVTQPLVQPKLERVVPGVSFGSVQINRTPVGVYPESVRISSSRQRRKELPAVLKDLRNPRIAFFFLHQMIASGTGVAERQAHLPRQLLLQRQVVVQHVRLLHVIVQKP